MQRLKTLLLLAFLATATAAAAQTSPTQYFVTGVVASGQDDFHLFDSVLGQKFTARIAINHATLPGAVLTQDVSSSWYSWVLNSPSPQGFSITLANGVTLATNNDPIFFFHRNDSLNQLLLNGGYAGYNHYAFNPPNGFLDCTQPGGGCPYPAGFTFQIQWLFDGAGSAIPNPLHPQQANIYYWDANGARRGNLRLAGAQGLPLVVGINDGSPDAGGPMNWFNEWDPTNVYLANDVVSRNGAVFLARAANLGSDPAGSADWIAISGGGGQGPAGPQGPAGATGPAGPAGPAGAQGLTGPQGPAGATGAPGQQGPIGLTGPQGNTGLTGAQGPTGPQGPAGPITPGSVVMKLAAGHVAPPAPSGYVFQGFTQVTARANGGGATLSFAVYIRQ